MTDVTWGLVLVAAIGAVPATIAAIATLKNGRKASERNEKAIARSQHVVEKLAENTEVTIEAKDKAQDALGQANHGLSVANQFNEKFLTLHGEILALHERTERHRAANEAHLKLMQMELDKIKEKAREDRG